MNCRCVMDINISSVLDWWEVWKLRLLVLTSTVIQFFLLFYGAARRAPVKRWLRVCIWLAYIAGDSLAIYALASLFNRHSRAAAATVGSILEVLWAPVLLIHLAGQEQITAYSIQDNELWARHIVTLVAQVTIALYVFCVSWSGDRRLLAAAILMFVIGIYKFSTKPWALKRACLGNLVNSPASVPKRKNLTGFSSRPCTECLESWTRTDVEGFIGDFDDVVLDHVEGLAEQEEKEAAEEELDMSEYVHKVHEARAGVPVGLRLAYTYEFAADILVPYSRRLKILQFMFNFGYKKSGFSQAVRHGMDEIYSRLYTRVKVATSRIGLIVRVITFSAAIAAIALFARTPKSKADVVDVKVTYILFSCIALLELLSFGNIIALNIMSCVVPPATFKLENMVFQQSLISSVGRRRKPPKLLCLARCIGYDDYVNRHWYITQTPASDMIHEVVLAHVNKGLVEYILGDPGRYRRFNDFRGQWAVDKRLSASNYKQQRDVLLKSIRRPFDESVLLWHVATEICFHHADATGGTPRKLANIISCYMMYLLSTWPEMLMLGTRPHLFSVALDDIKFMLQYSDLSTTDNDDRSIACALFRMAQNGSLIYRGCIGPLIPRACELANALLELLRLNEKETWEMVQDVWVEMLCYAATRGRGHMHAISHAERWELLSRLWLLLCFMGMETLADRLQRTGERYGAHGEETTGDINVEQIDT